MDQAILSMLLMESNFIQAPLKTVWQRPIS